MTACEPRDSTPKLYDRDAITSVEAFYAHALAIEREAAQRYAEFQAWFTGPGEEALAMLCRDLAREEHDHYTELVRRTRGLRLPQIAPGEYQWLDEGSPEAPAREVFHRVAKPRDVLQLALAGECRAVAFFERVARTSPDAQVRSLAREMVVEEARHVRWVRNALDGRKSTQAA
jgi:rubrerythrin